MESQKSLLRPIREDYLVQKLLPAFRRSCAASAPARHIKAVRAVRSLTPTKMKGWHVVLRKDGSDVGVVHEVMQVASADKSAQSYLLHVLQPAVLEPYGFAGQQEHYIPLVSDIVPDMDVNKRVLYLAPPAGLLQLGRQSLVLEFLKQELVQYALPAPTVPGMRDSKLMPSKQQLLAADRQDLVQLISEAGGFAEVALQLGLRARSRPKGYWENDDTLDRELSFFVAAFWVELPHPDTGRPYYYNQVSGRLAWSKPQQLDELSQSAASGAAGAADATDGLMPAEGPEDRVMPSSKMLIAAGRYDLHHAIAYQGGYAEVAERLGRRPAAARRQRLTNSRTLRTELVAFAREHDLPKVRHCHAMQHRVPSQRLLVDAGRMDLLAAINRLGGAARVAEATGLECQRRPRHQWKDVQLVVQELRAFIREHSKEEEEPLMPTTKQLRQAGRLDLAYAISLHGHVAVRQQLQLSSSNRGITKNVLQYRDVAGAVLAGCRTPTQVLEHLAAHQGYSVSRTYLNTRFSEWCNDGRLLKYKHGHYCLPAHVMLQLKSGKASAKARKALQGSGSEQRDARSSKGGRVIRSAGSVVFMLGPPQRSKLKLRTSP